MNELIFFEKIIKERIWGLEYWLVSAHENGDTVIKNGEYKGKTLSWLWNNKRDLFGKFDSDDFPLLVKTIDAKDDLSVQVHPNDGYAELHENGSKGKNETWSIMSCEPNGSIIIGHKASNIEEAVKMIEENRWGDFLRTISIKKGDIFRIAPGTVHAIKKNTRLMEIQQNSDITYRLYDYNRMQNGKRRQLNIEKSLDVIVAPYVEPDNYVTDRDNGVVTCQYYRVDRYEIKGAMTFDFNEYFKVIGVVEGKGLADGIAINEGDAFIVSAGDGQYTIEGEITILITYI